MIQGTCHFPSLAAAASYYASYGFSFEDVRRKLGAGEIHVGKPRLKPGQRAFLHPEESRFFIRE